MKRGFTNFALVVALTVGLIAGALAKGNQKDADVTYVGGGRNTCSGDARMCSRVRQGNDELQENRRAEREERQAREEARRCSDRSHWGDSRSYSLERHRYGERR
jgi:hypothetical protein